MKKIFLLVVVAASIAALAYGAYSYYERQRIEEAGEFPSRASAKPRPPEKPVLQAGERLYKGKANFAEAESFEVSFILSQDKSEIRDLKIAIRGLAVQAQYQNIGISVKNFSSTTTYAVPIPVREGRADASLFKNGRLSLAFNEGGASGTIKYIYVIDSSQGHPDIPVDLGERAISFQAE